MKREEKMGKSEKQMDKEHERNQRIIDTAFRLFVEKKIEAVSMDEVAKEAGVGRATPVSYTHLTLPTKA